jgi:hypothetical protein
VSTVPSRSDCTLSALDTVYYHRPEKIPQQALRDVAARTLLDESVHRSRGFFDRHVQIDTLLVEQIASTLSRLSDASAEQNRFWLRWPATELFRAAF